MKKNLVIFDFDGVIADSEKIWIKNRQIGVNKAFNLNWSFEDANRYFAGAGDPIKRQILDKMGYITDDAFWEEQVKMDMDTMRRDGLEVFDGVEDLIKKLPKKCIATGGIMEKTIVKLEVIGFWNKYFNESNLFAADMVKNGKPAPDIFLLAAEKMGEKKENCIIIEDSVAGITAAKRAGIDVIAFLGSKMYNNEEYINKIRGLNVKNICFTMKEVEKVLLDFL